MEIFEIKKLIKEGLTVHIKYNGEWGGLDPYYEKKTGNFYECFYKDVNTIVYDIDDAMNLPFVDGKSLNEIAGELEDVDW